MDRKRVMVSWSGGKDSMLALHQLMQDEDVEVVGLMTNFTTTEKMVKMHFVPKMLIQQQADALNLPVYVVELSPEADNEEFREATKKVLSHEAVDAVAFGDIFLEDVRAFREEVCAAAGAEAIFPLWHRSPRDMASEFLELGYSAIIVSMEGEVMNEDLLGHHYNESLLRLLPQEVDEAGEQGHFHTLVIDGPNFQQPVDVVINGKRRAKLKGAKMKKFLYCTFKV